jgi:hypothetical protein
LGEPVRFDYLAPAGCPDAEVFASRVRERTTRARPGEPGELARTFVVEVHAEPEGASARLSFTDVRGTEVVRAVRGDTCDEVVSAIALVTALAIEAGPSEPGATPPLPLPAPASVAPAPAKTAPPPEPRRALRRPLPDVVAWSLGIQTSVTSWLGPPPNLGVGAFGEVGRYEGPSARLTLLGATSHTLVEVEGEPSAPPRRADFLALIARLEGCPLAAQLGAGFRAIPCLAVGIGRLEGEGQRGTVEAATSKAIFWAELVPTLRFDWTLADSLVFFVEGELGVPLVRHDFGFVAPKQTAFSVPAVGGGAALGMAWRFQ